MIPATIPIEAVAVLGLLGFGLAALACQLCYIRGETHATEQAVLTMQQVQEVARQYSGRPLTVLVVDNDRGGFGLLTPGAGRAVGNYATQEDARRAASRSGLTIEPGQEVTHHG